MVNHFGRFIEKLAEKPKPLRDLLKENVGLVWDAPQQQAFDELKLDLQNSVELAPFNTAYRTIVSTDASSTGLGLSPVSKKMCQESDVLLHLHLVA
ncbi:hypothetical protein M513_14393 [Trichuris suis]|uniref:Reverse transcriptase/retrotransposon-derived protein RNase H-like domain-containing protein n=1 Tax=Trichuris suis TaxID=68888 RepID=A0A085LID4_9BILA|nr:hypothetical protein M513_14393 [Trichuris suis]